MDKDAKKIIDNALEAFKIAKTNTRSNTSQDVQEAKHNWEVCTDAEEKLLLEDWLRKIVQVDEFFKRLGAHVNRVGSGKTSAYIKSGKAYLDIPIHDTDIPQGTEKLIETKIMHMYSDRIETRGLIEEYSGGYVLRMEYSLLEGELKDKGSDL